MRLRELRKHYRKDGTNWIPKASFKTVDEARNDEGFNIVNYKTYRCTVCSSIHIGRR